MIVNFRNIYKIFYWNTGENVITEFKFKVQLYKKEGRINKESKLSAKIIQIQCDKSDTFNNLMQSLVQNFEEIQQPNASIKLFWQDNEQEWLTIDNQQNLLIAMQEMGGPMYKLKVTYEIQAVSGKSFNVFKIYSFI